jgi:hypothetical protein
VGINGIRTYKYFFGYFIVVNPAGVICKISFSLRVSVGASLPVCAEIKINLREIQPSTGLNNYPEQHMSQKTTKVSCVDNPGYWRQNSVYQNKKREKNYLL